MRGGERTREDSWARGRAKVAHALRFSPAAGEARKRTSKHVRSRLRQMLLWTVLGRAVFHALFEGLFLLYQ
jgi:hypothetical protein